MQIKLTRGVYRKQLEGVGSTYNKDRLRKFVAQPKVDFTTLENFRQELFLR